MMRRRLGYLALAALVLAAQAGSMAAAVEAPLAVAAMHEDLAEVRTLLAGGADPNTPQGDGMTALHWAAERGQPEIAAALLAGGARVSATTRLGAYTPLHLAARRGHDAVALPLIAAGADV